MADYLRSIIADARGPTPVSQPSPLGGHGEMTAPDEGLAAETRPPALQFEHPAPLQSPVLAATPPSHDEAKTAEPSVTRPVVANETMPRASIEVARLGPEIHDEVSGSEPSVTTPVVANETMPRGSTDAARSSSEIRRPIPAHEPTPRCIDRIEPAPPTVQLSINEPQVPGSASTEPTEPIASKTAEASKETTVAVAASNGPQASHVRHEARLETSVTLQESATPRPPSGAVAQVQKQTETQHRSATARAPQPQWPEQVKERPVLQIGRIDVIVESPTPKHQPAVAERSRSNLASQRFLRRL